MAAMGIRISEMYFGDVSGSSHLTQRGAVHRAQLAAGSAASPQAD